MAINTVIFSQIVKVCLLMIVGGGVALFVLGKLFWCGGMNDIEENMAPKLSILMLIPISLWSVVLGTLGLLVAYVLKIMEVLS